jgi:periplasmic protein CpxP/Spy
MNTSAALQSSSLFHRLLVGATLLLGVLVIAPELVAQAPGRMGNPQEMQARQLELLTTQLSLTPQQVEQVKPILAKQSEEQQALFQSSGGPQGDRAAMRTQMQALRERTDRQIETLLTPEQQTKLRALRQDETRTRAQRMGGS